jgi:uncharacterized protein YcbK (DUF882 family)
VQGLSHEGVPHHLRKGKEGGALLSVRASPSEVEKEKRMIAWLHPDKLSPALKVEVEEWVKYMETNFSGFHVRVNEDYASAGPDSPHVKDSQHFLGQAADLSIYGCSLFDAWLSAERFAFKGIGVYPYWNNPGLHLDVRTAPYRARWWRDAEKNYQALNRAVVSTMGAEVLA